MISSRFLTLLATVIWAAVAVTAAPHAFSRHHPAPLPSVIDSPTNSCSDLHVHFDDHGAVYQSEERKLTKFEAPTLRIQAESNGGLYVEGWDEDSYSVTLCKAAEAGASADSILSQIHLTFQDGLLRVSGPQSEGRWAADLVVRAPKASTLNLQVHNGPMTLSHVDGNLKVNAENGPIQVTGCSGELDLSSRNGPVTLEQNSGTQNVRAENGPLTLSLSGSSWSGSGLEARTTNGPLSLEVPSGYRSGVLLESDGHGPFVCSASVCSEGRRTWDDEHKRVEFGSGPALVRLFTVNGPISVR